MYEALPPILALAAGENGLMLGNDNLLGPITALGPLKRFRGVPLWQVSPVIGVRVTAAPVCIAADSECLWYMNSSRVYVHRKESVFHERTCDEMVWMSVIQHGSVIAYSERGKYQRFSIQDDSLKADLCMTTVGNELVAVHAGVEESDAWVLENPFSIRHFSIATGTRSGGVTIPSAGNMSAFAERKGCDYVIAGYENGVITIAPWKAERPEDCAQLKISDVEVVSIAVRNDVAVACTINGEVVLLRIRYGADL